MRQDGGSGEFLQTVDEYENERNEIWVSMKKNISEAFTGISYLELNRLNIEEFFTLYNEITNVADQD